jgi:hypothetical protein
VFHFPVFCPNFDLVAKRRQTTMEVYGWCVEWLKSGGTTSVVPEVDGDSPHRLIIGGMVLIVVAASAVHVYIKGRKIQQYLSKLAELETRFPKPMVDISQFQSVGEEGRTVIDEILSKQESAELEWLSALKNLTK